MLCLGLLGFLALLFVVTITLFNVQFSFFFVIFADWSGGAVSAGCEGFSF